VDCGINRVILDVGEEKYPINPQQSKEEEEKMWRGRGKMTFIAACVTPCSRENDVETVLYLGTIPFVGLRLILRIFEWRENISLIGSQRQTARQRENSSQSIRNGHYFSIVSFLFFEFIRCHCQNNK
jgi:hypothetical protein